MQAHLYTETYKQNTTPIRGVTEVTHSIGEELPLDPSQAHLKHLEQ
jgi:hypothetical protein